MLSLTHDDDLTPWSEVALAHFEAGATSDPLSFHLWNARGEPGGELLRDLLLVLYAEDPQAPGTWRRSGLPPLDELWARLRATGHDAGADPTQEPFTTDWRALGATRAFAVPSLHAGCARYFELQLRPPSTALAASWRFRLAVLHAEHAIAAPLTQDRGILTGVGDPARSGLVRGGEVTTSEPPDARVRIAAWQAVLRGRLVGHVGAELELPQLDGAGEALAPGESYWALVTAGAAGLTLTRGLRGPDPARPAPAVGELVLKWVRVGWEPAGASIVDAADLDGETRYDRHRVLAGTGLELRVHPGEAVAHGTLRTWSSIASVPVPASTTSRLWQLGDGRFEITTHDEPPVDTALGPLAEIAAGAEQIEAIRDLRLYAGRTRELRLQAVPGASPGLLGELLVADPELVLERVLCLASDPGAGTGATVIDVEVEGATIYPSAVQDDQRPRLASDATKMGFEGGVHERTRLRAGEVVAIRTALHPDLAPPARLEVVLVARMP